jgi:hypothetical protein
LSDMAETDIDIQGLNPSMENAQVPKSHKLVFKNRNAQDCFLRIFGPHEHPVLGIYVPANGSAAFVMDGKKDDKCTYDIFYVGGAAPDTGSSGGSHVIIITSG